MVTERRLMVYRVKRIYNTKRKKYIFYSVFANGTFLNDYSSSALNYILRKLRIYFDSARNFIYHSVRRYTILLKKY